MSKSQVPSQGEPLRSLTPGVISAHELYTLAEAKLRLRWTDAALRSAKRRGLHLLVCGKRRYLELARRA
ncbi:MAG: hypothetical protein ACJ8LM_08900, partial [Candidatus Udaeobacter sp.]